MKKVYEKPGIYVESFELAQSIAAGCSALDAENSFGGPMHESKEICGWGNSQTQVFTEAIAKCNFKWDENLPYNGICYNNPSSGLTIFAS